MEANWKQVMGIRTWDKRLSDYNPILILGIYMEYGIYSESIKKRPLAHGAYQPQRAV